MSMFKWEVVDPAPGEAVAPDQRLAWGKTVGVGAQHVVAMFGATFVFPLVMGLDPNLAIMMRGICTILLPADRQRQGAQLPRHQRLLRRRCRRDPLPRAATPRTSPARSWSPAWCSWPSACSSTSWAPALIHKVLPPAVTGAVVMLIGFNLAPVVAEHLLAARTSGSRC